LAGLHPSGESWQFTFQPLGLEALTSIYSFRRASYYHSVAVSKLFLHVFQAIFFEVKQST
jgi:hypothetical protein